MTVMDSLLLSLFERTALNDKQRRVYLALLQTGTAPVSQIARLAQLKRPHTYTIISELEQLGYVHQVMSAKQKMYAAADPNKLASELQQNAKRFEEMLPYLHAIQRRNGKPYVQYFSGLDGVSEAFSQIYRPKSARYVTSIERAQKAIPEEVARWQKIYIAGKAWPGSRHIQTDTATDRTFGALLGRNGQQVRYLKTGVTLNADIALVDSRVFLTSFEHGIHVSVISSPATYKALCTLYDLAWLSLDSFID